MKLNDLSNNQIALEETLKLFHKTEETEDGYITWCNGQGIPQLQINMYNNIIYILSDNFRIILNIKEKALEQRKLEEERKKRFDPFYLNLEKKGERIKGKRSQNTFREEEKQKKQERLHVSERLNVDYLIDTEEYLDDYQRDILINLSDSGFVSYKHILEECEPKYIDKYTTAYNSEIMRAILSHQ